MWLHISAVVAVLGCIFQAYMFMRAKRLYTKVGTPSASHNTGMDAISQQYYELLYSVEQKWPNESRHQTALRYIQQAERNSKCGGVAKQHHT
jgi:heme/copper-type cytochrome/quinol oxidase subunit 3